MGDWIALARLVLTSWPGSSWVICQSLLECGDFCCAFYRSSELSWLSVWYLLCLKLVDLLLVLSLQLTQLLGVALRQGTVLGNFLLLYRHTEANEILKRIGQELSENFSKVRFQWMGTFQKMQVMKHAISWICIYWEYTSFTMETVQWKLPLKSN